MLRAGASAKMDGTFEVDGTPVEGAGFVLWKRGT